MFAQMPLVVYRHFTGAVCTTSSDGRFALFSAPSTAAFSLASMLSSSSDILLPGHLLSRPDCRWSPGARTRFKTLIVELAVGEKAGWRLIRCHALHGLQERGHVKLGVLQNRKPELPADGCRLQCWSSTRSGLACWKTDIAVGDVSLCSHRHWSPR